MTMVNLDIVKAIVDFTSKNYVWDIFSIVLTGLFAALFLYFFEWIKDTKKEKTKFLEQMQSESMESWSNINSAFELINIIKTAPNSNIVKLLNHFKFNLHNKETFYKLHNFFEHNNLSKNDLSIIDYYSSLNSCIKYINTCFTPNADNPDWDGIIKQLENKLRHLIFYEKINIDNFNKAIKKLNEEMIIDYSNIIFYKETILMYENIRKEKEYIELTKQNVDSEFSQADLNTPCKLDNFNINLLNNFKTELLITEMSVDYFSKQIISSEVEDYIKNKYGFLLKELQQKNQS